MNIVIRDYLSGSFLLEREPKAWDAIVILNSGIAHTNFVAKHAREHLYVQFDDVDSDFGDKRAPTPNEIEAILGFAPHSKNLMVCCRAGQSRSSACAFLICYQRLGAKAAYEMLNPERHIPNSLIIAIGARQIDDPFVVATFAKWQFDNRNIRLSEYYDDIEREFNQLESRGARDRIVQS